MPGDENYANYVNYGEILPATSEARDMMMAADRAWFIEHPGCNEYWRPISAAEIAQLEMLGRPVGPNCKVRVMQIEPGVEARSSQMRRGGDSKE